MRVPHTIPVNTLRAYAASEQTLNLVAERYRTIRAEDLTWDEGVPPSLTTICVQVLAANFQAHYGVLPFLPQQDFDYLLEILSVDYPVPVVAPIVQDGIFWQRCCVSRWPNKPLDVAKHGDSWKRMYIERHLEEYIHYQEPGYIDWDDVVDLLTVCSPFVFRLEIRELKPPRTWGPEPNLPDKCIRGTIDPNHMDLYPVLPILINLSELSIRYGIIDCGMKYNPEFFRISIQDVTNLGEGLKITPSITILRLHRCAIDDIRLNILVEAMMQCNNIETLELSHCKFGDIGAKSLGKLMLSHTNLRELLIQNNRIEEDGAAGLAYALQHENCCPIRSLNLELNLIGEEGAICFSTAIVKNKTLRTLNLSGTGMTSAGAIKIAEALLFSPSIHEISVCNNHLDEDVAEFFIAAAQGNRRLETLDVRNTEIGEDAETTVHKFITRNRQLYRPSIV